MDAWPASSANGERWVTIILRGDVPEHVKIHMDEHSCLTKRCDSVRENVSPVLLGEYMRGVLSTLQLCLSLKRRPRTKFVDQHFESNVPSCCSAHLCAAEPAPGGTEFPKALSQPPHAQGDRPARVARSRARATRKHRRERRIAVTVSSCDRYGCDRPAS